MGAMTTGQRARKPIKIVLGPRSAVALGGYALIAMHTWFIVKLALPSADGLWEFLVGMAALTGLVTSVAFFICTYGVLANASERMLDERQATDRGRAYFGAFKYLVLLLFIGAIGSGLCARLFAFELSVPVLQNYLLLIFATAMVLPALLLAWRDVLAERP